MNYFEKFRKKRLKRRLINTAILLIFFVITVSTYYTANFSKAKDIIEISVNIKNSLSDDKEEEITVNATTGVDGKSFYIRLPQYINNKKVIKYSYCEETIQTTGMLEETEETIVQNNDTETVEKIEEPIEKSETEDVEINEITPNDVLPESKIYLTTNEVRDKKITILAHYDTKEENGQVLYNQLLEQQIDDSKITVTGYIPEARQLYIEEINKKDVQTIIREQTSKPVILAVAYDIKIKVGEELFEPYEVSESLNVKIEKTSLENKEVNIWHIDDANIAEQLEDNQENNITTFETEEFSIFAVEDVEATTLAIDGMSDSVLTINDAESDKNYWLGKNYTDDISGEYLGKYTESNLANLTINYHAYAQNEIEPEMVGWISLTERYNVVTYMKTCPIENGNVTIELIDNPFLDKPTGYGFGGWESQAGTITTNTQIDVQSLTVTGASNITIDIYANWVNATVVYVNGEIGNDNVNDGLTPENPFGSWSKAISYLRTNSVNVNDRERNIVVMTGDMSTPINYTQSKTYKGIFTAGTTFTPGEIYMISNTNIGSGGNAFSAYDEYKSNTILSDTTVPHQATQWKISAVEGGYTLQNQYTGLYFSYVGRSTKM